MQFVRVTDMSAGIEPPLERLVSELSARKHVLWLVPGGSNIPLSAAVMSRIPDELTVNLTIMLTDERYGEVGHSDSNTRQLDDAGFKPKQANVIPVLHSGLSLEETCAQYAADYETSSSHADVIIGQFGMGADGHIAGILPSSPAVASADLTAGYQAPNFIRITLTPKALQQLNAAYLFAFGSEKLPALQKLQSQDIPLDEQPVQLLKQLPEAFVYNDQIGDGVTGGET